jgi:hypothetical protein
MDATVLLIASLVGIVAIGLILARHDREGRVTSSESPMAASSEGETRCPTCGMGNLVGTADCVACGAPLPRHHAPPVS